MKRARKTPTLSPSDVSEDESVRLDRQPPGGPTASSEEDLKNYPNAGIYAIRNTLNDKIYIGQSIDVLRRMRQHLRLLVRGVHGNAHLQRAYNEYGSAAFRFDVFDLVPVECLDAEESKWITLYGSSSGEYGYNIDPAGCGSRVRSASTRAKIAAAKRGRRRPDLSKAMMGHPVSEGARRKIADAVRSRPPPSLETRAKLATWTGRKHTAATKHKMSVAAKGRVVSAVTRERMSEAFRKRPPISAELRLIRSINAKRACSEGRGLVGWLKRNPLDRDKKGRFKMTEHKKETVVGKEVG